MMRRLSGSVVGSLALLLAVAAYFAVGCTLSLEYIDEGQILYPSWLVALGAVPYRDFHQLYGPAVFWLNGALFRWIAPDLLVVRGSLVVLKTITVVLSYLITRHLASRAFALLAAAVLVAVWGTPWWVFNTPYANHYSLTLTLGGLLCFLSLPRHFRLGCGVAGLCFGCAATFKQTAGVFGLAGFALFLLLADDPRATSDLPSGPALPGWLVRGGRLVALGALLAVFVAYVWPRNSLWNILVVLTPVALTLAVATVRALRAPLRPGLLAGLWGTVYAVIGTAVPILAVGIYYGAQGLFSNLRFDLLRGLPQKVEWFTPFPAPTARALLFIGLLAAALMTVGFARARLWSRGRTRSLIAGRLVVVAVVLLLVCAGAAMGTDLLEYVRSRAWHGDVLAMWFAVPLAAVWVTGFVLVRWGGEVPSSPDRGVAPGRRTAVLLVFCNATTALLLFYPAADIFHVMMVLPAFTPLLAFLVGRFHRSDESQAVPAGRFLSGALIGGLAVWLAAPLVDHLISTYAHSRADTVAITRATAIHGTQPKFGEVASLVTNLASGVPGDRPLLALTSEQMLYFLTGRRSVAERDEFVFYLVGGGIISDDDARGLIDEREIIDRLAAAKPTVVDGGDGPASSRMRRVFGDVSRYIDSHYRVAASVGSYRVLEWAD